MWFQPQLKGGDFKAKLPESGTHHPPTLNYAKVQNVGLMPKCTHSRAKVQNEAKANCQSKKQMSAKKQMSVEKTSQELGILSRSLSVY